MSTLRRVGVPLAGVAVLLAVAGPLLQRFFADPKFLPPFDYLQYWAAGRLLLAGGDPYDADQLLALQEPAGWDRGQAVMMWNPPWALTLFAPAGLLPWRVGHLLWVLVQVGLGVGSGAALWRLAGGRGHWPLVVFAAVSFFPVVYLVTSGQCSGWLVAGVTGLLAAVRTGRPWLAAGLAVAAVKPHLLIPVWLVLALDATVSRRTRVLLGWGVLAGGLMAAAPLLADAGLWDKYLAALGRPATATHPPLSGWRPPLIGFWVRQAVAPDQFWIQAVPTGLAAVGTAVHWWRRRAGWDWARELPVLVLVGLLASPYGAWPTDLVLLMVPLAAAAARLADAPSRVRLGFAAAYVLCNAVALTGMSSEYFVWVTPAACLGCWVAARTPLRPPAPV